MVLEFLNSLTGATKTSTLSYFFVRSAFLENRDFLGISDLYRCERLFNLRLSPPYRFKANSPPHHTPPMYYHVPSRGMKPSDVLYHGKVSSLEITLRLLTKPIFQNLSVVVLHSTCPAPIQSRQRLYFDRNLSH